MKALISKPVNDLQRQFNDLCEKGGGVKGGPVRGKTLDLLKFYGQTLNKGASEEILEHLAAFPVANPWHVCFALGLCWGHLAQVDLTFTEAAVGALEHINDDDLKTAGSFCLERGPEPIINSLRGGNALFRRVVLPSSLPDTLERFDRAQQRWLGPIVHPTDRPPYIGSWNATAMFMTALFANPALAATQMEPKPVLPPGGPIFTGLSILHDAGLVTTPPDTAGIDGASFEPGVLYANNSLLQSLLAGCTGWSLTDVHSGVYLLGTRHQASNSWIKAKGVTAPT
ncbi:hypothetical protein [Caulobacter sp. BK020]|uniref:hypothetical protein n=1 Tax=Caulobacter sp. BK020 TaxID=2512117 RepID=UPI0010465EB9|nr:hypothetical protein [Caulobacter sp. BK020]TCS15998.1 hypothetical protein EV278_104172 [Caulobacter sp. BK020]